MDHLALTAFYVVVLALWLIVASVFMGLFGVLLLGIKQHLRSLVPQPAPWEPGEERE